MFCKIKRHCQKWIHFDIHCVLFDSFGFANNKLHSSTILDRVGFTSPFDMCLWAVSVHDFHKWESHILSNSSNNKGQMQICFEESLEETLVKISVEMFTKYYELYFMTNMSHSGLQYRCKIVSHFKALYYYRKGEYVKLLNTCDSIISQEIDLGFPEERKHPKCLPCQSREDLHCVSVLFDFQTLFGNDVTCLTGLISIVNPTGFEESINRELIREFRYPGNGITNVKHFQGKIEGDLHKFYVSRVSCFFLVYYLRFQSLIQLHYPKRDILSVLIDLKHAKTGHLFEDVLLLFVGVTLKRLQY